MPRAKGSKGKGGSKAGWEAAPKMLRDMRRVYRSEPEKDKTPALKRLRELLVSDPKKFLTMMHAQERDFKKGRGELAAQKIGLDEGSERALTVVEELLKEGKAKGEW